MNQTKLLSVLGPSSGPGVSEMLGLLWVLYFKTNGKRGLERLIYPEFAQLNLELGSSDPN